MVDSNIYHITIACVGFSRGEPDIGIKMSQSDDGSVNEEGIIGALRGRCGFYSRRGVPPVWKTQASVHLSQYTYLVERSWSAAYDTLLTLLLCLFPLLRSEPLQLGSGVPARPLGHLLTVLIS